MRTPFFGALALLSAGLRAQEAGSSQHQTWVLAMDPKGGIVSSLKPEEWKIEFGGRPVSLRQVESPEATSAAPQNWTLVFEPILDPSFRALAFQAAAEFLAQVQEGDRVLIVARTREGLVPLTPGLTTDTSAWTQALEKLPAVVCNTFEGTPGAIAPTLTTFTEPAPQATTSPRAPFLGFVKTYVAAMPKTATEGPYGRPESRSIKPMERLGFDQPTAARGKLKVVAEEMQSLERLFAALGKLKGPNHCAIFSRSEADDFWHPSVQAAIYGRFARKPGDDGGPAEAAEIATSAMKLIHASMRKSLIASGVTLYSVAGTGGAFRGNLAAEADTTGGFAFSFDVQLPSRFGPSILAFANRFRLTWEEPKGMGAAELQPLSVKTTRPGMKLFHPTQQ